MRWICWYICSRVACKFTDSCWWNFSIFSKKKGFFYCFIDFIWNRFVLESRVDNLPEEPHVSCLCWLAEIARNWYLRKSLPLPTSISTCQSVYLRPIHEVLPAPFLQWNFFPRKNACLPKLNCRKWPNWFLVKSGLCTESSSGCLYMPVR